MIRIPQKLKLALRIVFYLTYVVFASLSALVFYYAITDDPYGSFPQMPIWRSSENLGANSGNSQIASRNIYLKCPEAYATKEDYEKALTEYIATFSKTNPVATVEDVATDHLKFLQENGCQEALNTIGDNLNAAGAQ